MNRNSLPLIPAMTVLLAAVSSASAAEPVAEERDCVITPHEVVEVSSAVPGLLEEVLVERSDSVRAGQLLARLESRVEKASLALARAWASIDSEVRIEATSGALDQRRHDRITQLYESKAVALDDRDRAQTDAVLSTLRLRQARERRWIRDLDARKAEAALERRAVRSPMDGVVVERFRAAGEYVENQPIMRIARLDPLQVETVLPMALFGQVQAGMVAEVRAENTPYAAQRAVVRLVDRMGDAASGTFGVRLTLPNPGSRIPAGLRCRLRLLPAETAAVPEAPPSPRAAQPTPAPAPAQPPPAPATRVPVQADTPAAAAQQLAVRGEVTPDPADHATPQPAPGDHAPAPQSRCATLGPLNDEHAADRLAQTMATRGVRTWVASETASERIGFIVVTPKQRDLDATKQLAARLRRAGVSHLQVMYAGTYARRVSLGVYAGAVMAEHRRDEVVARGVAAQVMERTRERARWWVRVMAERQDAKLPVAVTAAANAVPRACSPADTRRAELLAGSGAAS